MLPYMNGKLLSAEINAKSISAFFAAKNLFQQYYFIAFFHTQLFDSKLDPPINFITEIMAVYFIIFCSKKFISPILFYYFLFKRGYFDRYC